MKRMKLWTCRAALMWLLAAVLTGAGCGGDEDASRQVAVVPKGTTHVFWKSIHAGALAAREELVEQGQPVEIFWKGPIREDDRSAQVTVVETFIGRGVDGLVLAPLDRKALVAPVELAARSGIPTVVIDSALDSGETISLVATDNFRGGELAGEQLAAELNGTGRVLMLRYQVGSASTEDREAGFASALKAYPDIEMVSMNQYAGATRDTAYTAAQNLLNRFGGKVDGVFASNESATNGMLLALREAGLAGEVAFVGFDGGEQNLAALRAEEIDALVIQDPFRMGYEGVRTLVRHLNGESIPEVLDTGVTVVTKDRLEEAEVQRLLNPPLERIDQQ